ncbi:MAG TPA: NAD(P)/FAD-dependent oxidoreductase [Actinomycetota bacterium]|nr:NAD(P)/FAD-dependent oxidoreductase [Actinomycetota bacterium]
MSYDVVVIGAGAAGEAAASLSARMGDSVAVVEQDLLGGLCAFWACMPSKSLLDSANRRAKGREYPWSRASDRRDWMISREGIDYPDDSGHASSLEKDGAEVVRGTARIMGPGKVEVRSDGSPPRQLETRNLILSVGSRPVIPSASIEGLAEAGYWTSNEGTALRELPSSILVLGGGAVGVELAQVYARFGIPTTLVQGTDRILPRDHPRSSEVLAAQLEEEGVDIRTGVTATSVRAGGSGRLVELNDGTSLDVAQIMIAVGRRPADLRELGAEEAGARLNERGAATPDPAMRVGEGLFVAGDCAGGAQFTHVADYEGRIAARNAHGQDVRADLSAVPRTTFTDPETAAVGMNLQEAWENGMDAFEVTQDFAQTARGQTLEGSRGHITAVIDRERETLVGAFAACPGASELIHEAVLAIKLRVPIPVLADTIHAFPTGARVLGNVLAEGRDRLASRL